MKIKKMFSQIILICILLFYRIKFFFRYIFVKCCTSTSKSQKISLRAEKLLVMKVLFKLHRIFISKFLKDIFCHSQNTHTHTHTHIYKDRGNSALVTFRQIFFIFAQKFQLFILLYFSFNFSDFQTKTSKFSPSLSLFFKIPFLIEE